MSDSFTINVGLNSYEEGNSTTIIPPPPLTHLHQSRLKTNPREQCKWKPRGTWSLRGSLPYEDRTLWHTVPKTIHKDGVRVESHQDVRTSYHPTERKGHHLTRTSKESQFKYHPQPPGKLRGPWLSRILFKKRRRLGTPTLKEPQGQGVVIVLIQNIDVHHDFPRDGDGTVIV